MFSWANRHLEKLSETLAPPPSTPQHRFLAALASPSVRDENAALAVLNDPVEPLDPYAGLNQRGMTAVHVAAAGGAAAVVRELVLRRGVAIESADGEGMTALHHAGACGDPPSALATARLLLEECGANVLARDYRGRTPYDAAATQAARGYLLPKQLQRETKECLDNGGAGLVPGMDMGGMAVNVAPPPTASGGPPSGGGAASAPGLDDNDPLAALMRPTVGVIRNDPAAAPMRLATSGSAATASYADPSAQERPHVKETPPPTGNALPDGWVEATDPTSGNVYYYNQTTGASSWERPADAPRAPVASVEPASVNGGAQNSGAVVGEEKHVESSATATAAFNAESIHGNEMESTQEKEADAGEQGEPSSSDKDGGEGGAVDAANASPAGEALPDGWVEATDPSSGNTYYYNHGTGESSWERPSNAPTEPVTLAEPASADVMELKATDGKEGIDRDDATITAAGGDEEPSIVSGKEGPAEEKKADGSGPDESSTSDKPVDADGDGGEGKVVDTQDTSPAEKAGLHDGWVEATDPSSGKVYYYNHGTGASSWERPTNGAVEGGGGETSDVAAGVLPEGWTEATDPTSGGVYYYNHATGVTQWERPEAAKDAVVVDAAVVGDYAPSLADEISEEEEETAEGEAEPVQVGVGGSSEPSNGQSSATPFAGDAIASSSSDAIDKPAAAAASATTQQKQEQQASPFVNQPQPSSQQPAQLQQPAKKQESTQQQQKPPTSANSARSNPSAPSSGRYALRGGHANTTFVLREAKYKPDGFHTSSNDKELQAKYGHVDNEHERARKLAVAPPPISGGGASAPASCGGPESGGFNPYSSAGRGPPPGSGGFNPRRYPSYGPASGGAPSSFGAGSPGAASDVPAYNVAGFAQRPWSGGQQQQPSQGTGVGSHSQQPAPRSQQWNNRTNAGTSLAARQFTAAAAPPSGGNGALASSAGDVFSSPPSGGIVQPSSAPNAMAAAVTTPASYAQDIFSSPPSGGVVQPSPAAPAAAVFASSAGEVFSSPPSGGIVQPSSAPNTMATAVTTPVSSAQDIFSSPPSGGIIQPPSATAAPAVAVATTAATLTTSTQDVFSSPPSRGIVQPSAAPVVTTATATPTASALDVFSSPPSGGVNLTSSVPVDTTAITPTASVKNIFASPPIGGTIRPSSTPKPVEGVFSNQRAPEKSSFSAHAAAASAALSGKTQGSSSLAIVPDNGAKTPSFGSPGNTTPGGESTSVGAVAPAIATASSSSTTSVLKSFGGLPPPPRIGVISTKPSSAPRGNDGGITASGSTFLPPPPMVSTGKALSKQLNSPPPACTLAEEEEEEAVSEQFADVAL